MTEEMRKCAWAPQAISATMSRWSGMVTPRGLPSASVRTVLTTLPMARTELASPTHLHGHAQLILLAAGYNKSSRVGSHEARLLPINGWQSV